MYANVPVTLDVVFVTRFLRDKVNNSAFYCCVGMEIVALRPHIKINRGRLACGKREPSVTRAFN